MFDIGTILLFLALLVPVALFVGRPFLERSSSTVSQEEQDHSTMLAERDRILDAIQELDFDHAMGKIPQDLYPTQRTRLLQQGAEVLRQLDALQPSAVNGAALEAALIARREALAQAEGRAPAPAPRHIPVDDIEKMIAARRQAREGKAAGFCHRCGNPIQKTDQFCAKCGATQTTS